MLLLSSVLSDEVFETEAVEVFVSVVVVVVVVVEVVVVFVIIVLVVVAMLVLIVSFKEELVVVVVVVVAEVVVTEIDWLTGPVKRSLKKPLTESVTKDKKEKRYNSKERAREDTSHVNTKCYCEAKKFHTIQNFNSITKNRKMDTKITTMCNCMIILGLLSIGEQ